MKKIFKKSISLTLALAMVLSLVPNTMQTYAAEPDVSIEETSEEAEVIEETTETSEVGIPTEEVTEEVPTELVSEPVEPEVTTEAVTEDATTEVTTEVITETVTEEATEETTEEPEIIYEEAELVPTFDHLYEGVDVSGKDFSSCELLIATGDSSIFTADTEVASEYDGIYLTKYPDATQTMYAYSYYYTKANLVLVNSASFKVADEVGENIPSEDTEEGTYDGDVPQQSETEETSDENVIVVPAEPLPNDGHGEADLSGLNTGYDAFSQVNSFSSANYSGFIALIDTGASGADASVSVLGGGAGDDNGHGTRMANRIREVYPGAKILSIKALDSSGRGQASAVYAAIQYAINANVKIINLSIASINSSDTKIVVDAINEAIANGITVVGAAGNYGTDASYFVPGCVGGVITCTATDKNGVRLANANYGSAVDYFVEAPSSSEAAATVSALIARDGLGFSSELVRTEEGSEEATETDATIGDAPETDSVEEVKATEEARDLNNQANLNEHLKDLFPWLGGTFAAQAPTGYPNSFTADVWFNQTTDHANSDGVIGYLADWNVRSININQYDYVAGSQAVYCGCVSRGVASVSHSYANTGGGHTHYSGPAGAEHLCITPGAQAGNWNRLQISNTTFVYVDQITYNGLSYARYKTTDGVDQFLDTAGVQYVDIYVYLRLTEQPGFISLHKTVKKQNGSASSVSPAGAKYGLYDDEHPDTNGNTKIAEFTLGADGWPSTITLTTARAGSSDGVVNGDDGHKYLKWVSQSSPQNWYFKEISAPSGLLLDTGSTPIQYSWTTKHAEVTDIEFAGLVEIFKYDPDGTGNRGYGLSGGVFNVRNAAGTTIGTITTNSSGYGYFGGLAPGSYSIVEATAPQYHVKNNTVYSFTIRADGTLTTNPTPTTNTATYQTWNNGVNNNNSSKVSLALANADAPVYLTLQKNSANPSCTNGNPNYSLAGAEYKVFTSAAAASQARASKNYSAAIGTLTTNASGASNSIDVSNYMRLNSTTGAFLSTQFFVIETKAPKNYKLSTTTYQVDVSSANVSSNPAKVTVSDEPVNDPVNITVVKQFKDGHTEPLQGAKFSVKFYAQNIDSNLTFERLSTLTANWSGTFTTGNDGRTRITYNGSAFPLGYITIEEITPPDGFNIEGSVATIGDEVIPSKMAVVFTSTGDASTGYQQEGQYIINEDGTRGPRIVNATISNPIIISDEEVTADFELRKENKSGEPLPGVEFEITNTDTNESFTFITDENGYFSSRADYISHSAEDGIWFINGPQNIVRDMSNDDKGALVAGNYVVREIDAKGHQKEEPVEFAVDTDGELYIIYDTGRGDGLQVITDMEMPKLGTLALVEMLADGATFTDEEYAEIMANINQEAYSLPEGISKTLPATSGQKITDICQYSNLRYDTDYTLYGRLMQITEDGSVKPFFSDGNEVTGITNFHTSDSYEKSQYEACGYATVEFTDLDFTGLEDTKFVVFERLYLGTLTEEDIDNEEFSTTYDGNNDVVEFPLIHEDATDKNQTVKTPSGHTTAKSSDGTKTVSSRSKHFTFIDEVAYEGLIPGKQYEVLGQVYQRPNDDTPEKVYSDEEMEALKLKDSSGKEVTASTKFTASETGSGTVEVKFDFDADYEVEKRTYVVFEKCYDAEKGDILVFSHADIHDNEQSIYEPLISTQAKGTEERSELCYTEGKFIDTIKYENLEANATYIVEGVAMDKETGKELLLNGKPVKATATFKTGDATNPNGAVDGSYDLVFEVSEDQIADLEGKTLVVFETLKNASETVIATHEDIEDKDQELTIPEIITTLTDAKTGSHIAYPDQETKLIDTVAYSNLIPGKSYEMSGVLMNKATEKPLLDEKGNEITGSSEFIADISGCGVVEIVFTFNAKLLKVEGESVVAFEKCIPSDGTIPVGVHMDINDKDQTVDIPKVGTKVSKSKWTSKETISLTDTISYKNLTVERGYKYIAKGWLVDHNGTKLVVDGKEVYKEVEFTPTSKDGVVDVKFDDFSAAGLSGKYVVFEEVYVVVPEHEDENGNKITTSTHLVGEHKDLTDTNQTITVSNTPKTGDRIPLILIFILLFTVFGSTAAIITISKMKRKYITR